MSIVNILCLVFCCVHLVSSLVSFISNLVSGKRVKELCSKCGYPIYYGDDSHSCQPPLLSDDQLHAVLTLIGYKSDNFKGDK